MSELPRVERALRSGALLAPEPHLPGTVALARALDRLGREAAPPGDDPPTATLMERIGPAPHHVLALVDGLGIELLERLPAGSFLRRHLAIELRAVCPSTTAAALTSLATGAWPGEHAITGWWTHLPERGLTATILPYVERWSGRPLDELGLTPAEAFPLGPLAATSPRALHSHLPGAIADSSYSRCFRGPARVHPYERLSGAVDALLATLAAAPGPTYSYLYWPALDAAAHAHGPRAPEVLPVLAEADRELARLAQGLGPAGGRLAVTADHGFMEVPPDGKRVFPRDDPLYEDLLVPPTGEPRLPLFHLRPGREASFRARFAARLGEEFALLALAEAEALGLFGPAPLGARARARFGDLVGVPLASVALHTRPVEAPWPALIGYHAGLLPAEMRIPLVLA